MSVSVPKEAILNGPAVQWDHVDGPLMHWAGLMHWLTWRERIALWLRLVTVEQIATMRFPFVALQHSRLKRENQVGY